MPSFDSNSQHAMSYEENELIEDIPQHLSDGNFLNESRQHAHANMGLMQSGMLQPNMLNQSQLMLNQSQMAGGYPQNLGASYVMGQQPQNLNASYMMNQMPMNSPPVFGNPYTAGQPGMYGQGLMPFPPGKPQRKSSCAKWVFVVVLAAALGGGAYYYIDMKHSEGLLEGEENTDSFCEKIKKVFPKFSQGGASVKELNEQLAAEKELLKKDEEKNKQLLKSLQDEDLSEEDADKRDKEEEELQEEMRKARETHERKLLELQLLIKQEESRQQASHEENMAEMKQKMQSEEDRVRQQIMFEHMRQQSQMQQQNQMHMMHPMMYPMPPQEPQSSCCWPFANGCCGCGCCCECLCLYPFCCYPCCAVGLGWLDKNFLQSKGQKWLCGFCPCISYDELVKPFVDMVLKLVGANRELKWMNEDDDWTWTCEKPQKEDPPQRADDDASRGDQDDDSKGDQE